MPDSSASSSSKTYAPKTGAVGSPFRDALDHMNKDHKHHLSLIVSHHLNLSRPPTSLRMTRLDERGFEVEYKSIASFWKPTEPRGLRIEWQESGGGAKTISSGREARPLLVKLSEDATKAKSKQTPRLVYSIPPELPLAIVLFLFLHYLSTTHPLTHLPSERLTDLYISLRKTLRLERSIPLLLKAVGAAHVVESFGMLFYVLQRRRGSFAQALLWGITALPLGFPTFQRFNQINKTWTK